MYITYRVGHPLDFDLPEGCPVHVDGEWIEALAIEPEGKTWKGSREWTVDEIRQENTRLDGVVTKIRLRRPIPYRAVWVTVHSSRTNMQIALVIREARIGRW